MVQTGTDTEGRNGQPQQTSTQSINTTIPKKKKKKKGTKIVVGGGPRIINDANHQESNGSTPRNSEYRIPRKPDRLVAPAKNPNDRTGTKKTNNDNNNTKNSTNSNRNINNYNSSGNNNSNNNNRNKNAKAKTHSNNSNGNPNHPPPRPHEKDKNVVILTHTPKPADPQAIRAALKSELPHKLKFALGRAKLELNQQGQFFVQREAGVHHNYGNVRKIVQKHQIPGWLEWLQGRRGWILATDKHPYLDYHRNIHEAYTDKLRALLKQAKEADSGLYKSLVVLYYKQDPLTQENGGSPVDGAKQNTQTLWKKVSKTESLQDAVGKIRPFLEVIRYFCTDPRDKWKNLPWLAIAQETCRKRLDTIERLVSTLMRSSDWGPDVPVHWAAHPALNHYPRSVVTPSTMIELIVGMANILSQLFLPYPITVTNLDGVDKLLPKFSLTLNTPKGPSANHKKEPSSTSSSRKPSSSKNSANRQSRPTSSEPMEPLIIDLTGLSIQD